MLSAQVAHAHGDNEGPVSLELSSSSIKAGKSTIKLQLVENEKNKLVGDSDLNITHERKLHLFIFDPSLKEFQHVHPTFTASADKQWTVDVELSVNGKYWVWAQGELAEKGEEFTANSRIKVLGGATAWPENPLLSDVRSNDDAGSIVTLGSNEIRANEMVMLNLKFSRKDGSKPEITPYLGAIAHVVATSSDGDGLVHVHPMGSVQNAMVHIEFPAAGFYRLWVQYLDGKVLKTVPLSVEVK